MVTTNIMINNILSLLRSGKNKDFSYNEQAIIILSLLRSGKNKNCVA